MPGTYGEMYDLTCYVVCLKRAFYIILWQSCFGQLKMYLSYFYFVILSKIIQYLNRVYSLCKMALLFKWLINSQAITGQG